jgi:hypothetical protein
MKLVVNNATKQVLGAQLLCNFIQRVHRKPSAHLSSWA